MRIKQLAPILCLALLCFACGPKKETLTEKIRNGKLSVDEAYATGVEHMAERKYQDARQWFRLIEAHSPNSKYFSSSKLRIADTYFFDKMATYIEASVEYKSFLTHFPTHPKADYALYQYAMCFFTEIESADRDQTSTFTAYTEFKNLIDRYPKSVYAEKARDKIALCQLRLAEHEFTVGYYYFRRGRGFEQSAESRFKGIIDNYESTFDEEKTYFYLAETLWRREKYKEAHTYYKFLEKNHPGSEYRPFVLDKLARWDRIQEEGVDPGEISAGASDPIRDKEVQ